MEATAVGAQGFPEPDRNPFVVSKACSKPVLAGASSWMKSRQVRVKKSIISM
jgi:hypothetical protein